MRLGQKWSWFSNLLSFICKFSNQIFPLTMRNQTKLLDQTSSKSFYKNSKFNIRQNFFFIHPYWVSGIFVWWFETVHRLGFPSVSGWYVFMDKWLKWIILQLKMEFEHFWVKINIAFVDLVIINDHVLYKQNICVCNQNIYNLLHLTNKFFWMIRTNCVIHFCFQISSYKEWDILSHCPSENPLLVLKWSLLSCLIVLKAKFAYILNVHKRHWAQENSEL